MNQVLDLTYGGLGKQVLKLMTEKIKSENIFHCISNITIQI